MRVGLTLDFRNLDGSSWRTLYEDNLWLFCEAEAMGFDLLLTQEHFFMPDGYGASAPVVLSQLAARTKTARIGSYIRILPLAHAAQLAQELAVLDHLSGGRLEVGGRRRLGRSRVRRVRLHAGRARCEDGGGARRPSARLDTASVQLLGPVLRSARPRRPAGPAPAPAPVALGRRGDACRGRPRGKAPGEPCRHGGRSEVLPGVRARAAEAGPRPGRLRRLAILVDHDDVRAPDRVWERNRDVYFRRWDLAHRLRVGTGEKDISMGSDAGSDYRGLELIGDPETILDTIQRSRETYPITQVVVSMPPGLPIRTEQHRRVGEHGPAVPDGACVYESDTDHPILTHAYTT